jgi:hypothetical protein
MGIVTDGIKYIDVFVYSRCATLNNYGQHSNDVMILTAIGNLMLIVTFPDCVFILHSCKIKCSNVKCKSALFWDITRRRVEIVYRRFGTTYQCCLHRSRV